MIKNFALLHNVKICKCETSERGQSQYGEAKDGDAISKNKLKKLLEKHPKHNEKEAKGSEEGDANPLFSAQLEKYESGEGKIKKGHYDVKDDSHKDNPNKVTHSGYSYIDVIQGDDFIDKNKLNALDTKLLSHKSGEPKNARNYAGNGYDAKEIAKHLGRREIDEAARALLLLIERECGNGIFESPRYDSEKLIARLSTKSLTSLSKIKKEEMHRKRLLVLCDISGSCATICNEMAAACYKLIEYDDRICIMFISNDGPWKVVGDGVDDGATLILEKLNKILNGDYNRNGYGGNYSLYPESFYSLVRDLYQELVNYLCIKAAIGFSDDHARQTFRALAETGIDMFYFANQNISALRAIKADDKLTDEERKDMLTFAIRKYLRNWRVLPKLIVDGVGSCINATKAVIDYLTIGEGKIHKDG